jgi:hypothetical protein
MRYANFEVPSDVIADFVREMAESQLQATIVGVNEDDEIIIRVGYERDDAGKVDELEDHLAELVEYVYEEEEEDENEK